MSASPVPPAQKSNNAILWILGIIGGGILVLIVCGLLLASFIIRRVHVRQEGDKVEIETPVGAVKVNKEAPSTGLPVYPGATAEKSEGANIEFSGNDTRAGIAVEKFHCSDSREKVQAWYAKHLGPNFRVKTGKLNGENKIDGVPTEIEQNGVAFVDDRNNGARVVVLKEAGEETEIILIRVGKQEPQ